MPLSLYGVREWGVALAIALALSVVAWWIGWWWALLAIWPAWLCVAAFFRDPIRDVPTNLPDDAFLSPADGKITAIERVDAHEATGGSPAVIIRIFLSVLDVHINRSPCRAAVVRCDHRPGRHLDARTAESARVNESNLIILDRGGETIGVRQVSGAIARRIVCPLAPGRSLARGERIGMIKFGSTTELILPRPDQVAVQVRIGEKVYGGLTVLAQFTAAPLDDAL